MKRVAVIGSGISGLSSAYLFQQSYEVHLFEADSRLGGHANTVTARGTPVDTGFIVFNDLNYPHLKAFFEYLDVPVAATEMTLSVKFAKPNLEWGGTSVATLISQKRNVLRPRFWSMVRDILRFNKEAEENLQLASAKQWTLRELLAHGRYQESFVDWYLVPMGAAIWSTPTLSMLDFPAETFLRFCINHRLLQVNGRPQWRTVQGGSIEYVKKVAARLKHVHLTSPVERVERFEDHVRLVSRGIEHRFDMVIFATHPPQTLQILGDANEKERGILGAFNFQKNVAQLHGDRSYLPKRKNLWSAWNVQGQTKSQAPVSLTYWMNCLQPLETEDLFLVSLNAEEKPKELHREIDYKHPLFTKEAIAAQSKLTEIQGRGGIFHTGAWTRYGFHEDGILSAVRVAEACGLPIPWQQNQFPEVQTA